MSEAPEYMYVAPSKEGGWADAYAGDWPSPANPLDTKYRRDDLPPSREAALAVPEVKALVEALNEYATHRQSGIPWNPKMPKVYVALAALQKEQDT